MIRDTEVVEFDAAGFAAELAAQATLDRPMTVTEIRNLIELFPATRMDPPPNPAMTEADCEVRFVSIAVSRTTRRRWWRLDAYVVTQVEPFRAGNQALIKGERKDDGFRLVTRRGNEREFRTLEALLTEMRQTTGEYPIRLTVTMYAH